MEVVLTAFMDRGRELIQELAGLGNFWETDFKDVVRGHVENPGHFFDELKSRVPSTLSRFTPIRLSFQLSADGSDAEAKFKEVLNQLADEIEKGETFCVKVYRRGLKGAFSPQELAKELGSLLDRWLQEKYGVKSRADLREPDKALVFETVGRWCGVGLVSKKMRQECRYMKLP
jgi:tRNA(Ser,Leu) C12 N-acetylase TAN1